MPASTASAPPAATRPGVVVRRRAADAPGGALDRAVALPVARVAVDSGQPHLDRPFDYSVPTALAGVAQPGVRVRVRFSGRQVDGLVLDRVEDSGHPGALSPLLTVVSAEQVLPPRVLALCRAVADRCAGSLWDVLRLALPPRHARVEAEPRRLGPQPRPPVPLAAGWERYRAGPGFLGALAAGRSPRAIWSALPGPGWPDELATAVRACAASGRGALVVVPDARDAARVEAALRAPDPLLEVVALRADLGPAARYRAFLHVLRGEVRVVVGTRAAAFAPVHDLGLVAVWDDGDDLHAEPRAPYPHVRDVLVQRAHLEGAAVLLGGFARTAEAQLLLDTGWARPLEASRAVVRAAAPRVDGTSDDDLDRDPLARAARLPALAFAAARSALAAGAPVLVQVPRRGYVPSLACVRDRTPARCAVCAGPLGTGARGAVAACRWCGALAATWRCPVCDGTALRAAVVGAGRTAEELGRAFPGSPVRTSGRDAVLDRVAGEPAVVVSTPGAEPVADGGYGAVLLLDGWAFLGRADLRAGEEALRRWAGAAALARPGPQGGRVVVVADLGVPAVQALVRWDPAGAAARELAERAELGFPPATRMASVDGPAACLAQVAQALDGAPVELLGPVPHGDGQRLLVRAPRAEAARLAASLASVQAVRSAAKAEPVRVRLDPPTLA